VDFRDRGYEDGIELAPIVAYVVRDVETFVSVTIK
jgi:hypothetical protein